MQITSKSYFLAQNTEDSDQEMTYYLLLRGLLQFQSDYKTYPGLLDRDVEPDINRFKVIYLLKNLLKQIH
jgi:hypothetical protein